MVIIQGVDAACAGRNRTTATSVAFKLGHIADAVDERNRRWCSDGFEIGCDNGERVRFAFALDCCDREAMSFLAATSGISGDDVRDLMGAAVEHRFGAVDRLPATINGCRTTAAATLPTIPAALLETSVLNR
jgi:transposase InsO family protein